jgi:hypothetical protein
MAESLGVGGGQSQANVNQKPVAPTHYGYHEIAKRENNGMKDIENPIDIEGITFSEALQVTEAGRKKLEEVLRTLPKRLSRNYLPGTLSEATSYVNAREDAKKKQGVPKLGGDVVSVSAQKEGPYPGVLEGAGEAAAFWLYVEDYFRNVCIEDVHELLNFLKPFEEEDSFFLQPIGKKEGIDCVADEAPQAPFSPASSSPHGVHNDLIMNGRRSRRANSRLSADNILSGVSHGATTPPSSRLAGPSRNANGSSSAVPMLGAETDAPNAMTTSLTPEGAPARIAMDVLTTEKMVKLAKTMDLLSSSLGMTSENHDRILSLEASKATPEDIKSILQKEAIEIGKKLGNFPVSVNATAFPPQVPDPKLVHPWTDLLMKTKVPSHVKEVVKDAYFLDPPGSLAQRCSAGHLNVLDPQDAHAAEEQLANEDVELTKHVEKVSLDVLKSIQEGPEVTDTNPRILYDLATKDLKVIRAAPQDELAAETLALQAELVSVMAANRARLAPVIDAILEDLPRQKSRESLLQEEYNFAKGYFDSLEAAKDAEDRLKKEMALRQSKGIHALAGGGSPGSNRPVIGNTQRTSSYTVIPYLQENDLYDVLARRKEDDEAFCAVCGDGFSAEPNVIIFCDRCDVAVHQKCYDIVDVPQHEWLCWPCKEYEEKLRSEGKSQEEIRPLHALPEQRSSLPGGSKEVTCFLCPLKYGAFRRSVDGASWVHQTCAMWHPETYLLHGSGPNVVEGLWDVSEDRIQRKCNICNQTQGAVVECPRDGCHQAFHVLCARNCGLYLTVQKDAEGHQHHRIYCSLHSKEEQEKDSMELAMILSGTAKPKPPPLPAAAPPPPPPQQPKATKRKAEDDTKKKELAALATMEFDYSKLQALRVNFEVLRVLLDQCKRREKVKKQLIQISMDLFKERLEDPSEALEFVKKLESLSQKGLSPSDILVEIWPLEYARSATPKEQNKKAKTLATAVENSKEPQGILYMLNDTRTKSGRSSRRVVTSIEREKILSSSEADLLNKKLPAGYKYVPASTLNDDKTQ